MWLRIISFTPSIFTPPPPLGIAFDLQSIDEKRVLQQERFDAEHGVVVTDIGRYVPPSDVVRAAAVLVRRAGAAGGILEIEGAAVLGILKEGRGRQAGRQAGR